MSVPVSVGGSALSENPVYVLGVSPGWFDTMKIPLLGGRDFRTDEVHPSVVVVNKEFAKEYFNGEDPVGRSFEKPVSRGKLGRVEVVGVVGNAKYDSMREPMKPTLYVPFGSIDEAGELRPYARASCGRRRFQRFFIVSDPGPNRSRKPVPAGLSLVLNVHTIVRRDLPRKAPGDLPEVRPELAGCAAGGRAISAQTRLSGMSPPCAGARPRYLRARIHRLPVAATLLYTYAR